MRSAFPLVAIALMSCNGQNGTSDHDSPNGATGNAATINPLSSGTMEPLSGSLGDEPSTSPSAKEATRVLKRYFSLIEQRKYSAARMLWGNNGADSRSDDRGFAKSFEIYDQYLPVVGDPSDISSRDGSQYMSVQAKVRVRLKRNGVISDLSGPILLRRSANRSESSIDKRFWRIWGTDLRVRR